MNELRKFLLVQMVIGIVINLTLNAGIGIFMVRGINSLPLWGNPGVALDTLAVAFLLPWLTVLVVAPFARVEMKKGTVTRFQEELRVIRRSYLHHMPRGVLAQSMVIAGGTTLVITPVMIGILYALGISEMGAPTFVLYKSAFATILTFPVSPLAWTSALVKYIKEE